MHFKPLLITLTLTFGMTAHGSLNFKPGDGLKQKQADAIMNIFNGTSRLISPHLKTPQVTIQMEPEIFKPFYTSGQIIVGYDWKKRRGSQSMTCLPRYAPWIHVYGLAAFDANMRDEMPAWKELFGGIEDGVATQDTASYENTQKIMNNSRFESLEAFQKPYAELFADFLAMTYSNDASVMYQCRTSIGEARKEDKIAIPSQAISAKNMPQYLDSKLNPDLYLAAARSHLWKIYEKPACKKAKSVFMRDVFKTLSREIKAQWKEAPPTKTDIIKVNERLISAFDTNVKCSRAAFATSRTHSIISGGRVVKDNS